MNLLVEELPDSVEIDGKTYEINTDFRGCIRTIMAFEDEDITEREQVAILLTNLYRELPPNVGEAIRLGLKFLNGGDTEEDGVETSKRFYSFSQDSGLIYAAFSQTHGIDLTRVTLHWWAFMALFMDLGQDTTFCNLVSLRKRVKEGKASKEERQLYNEIRDIAYVPDRKTREQREIDKLFFGK